MRRVPQQHANSYVRRERDPRTLTRQAMLLASCVVLAAGFVFAARQKIAAVQYGYRSEELRRERERLLEEQHRLLVAVEESSSPVHLERAARTLGLQPARAAQIGAGEQARPEAGAVEEAPAAAPTDGEGAGDRRRRKSVGTTTAPASAAFAGAALPRH
jgi:hypothetical protein